MASGARFIVPKLHVDVSSVFGLHAGDLILNPDVLKRHYRCVLLPHVFESECRPAFTKGREDTILSSRPYLVRYFQSYFSFNFES